MKDIFFAFCSAFWLGILTSISPCSLATNIAAVSYLSRKSNLIKQVISLSIAYTIGRMFAYTILGILIIASLLSIPSISHFLQNYMNNILGPILILVGLFLLDIIKLNIPAFSISHDKQELLVSSGITGSFSLGILFALSFCPISAALFFGSLIPLSLQNKFGIILPLFYGIGTALPVLLFAMGITFGLQSLNKWFHMVSRIELFTRKITGVIFIVAGLYYIWSYLIPTKMIKMYLKERGFF